MRPLLVLIIAFSIVSTVHAAPFLVSDPPTDGLTDYYVITGLPGGDNSPKDPTGEFGVKHDLAGISAGTYTLNVQACSSLWGVCHPGVPFSFTKPSTLTGPAAVRLSR